MEIKTKKEKNEIGKMKLENTNKIKLPRTQCLECGIFYYSMDKSKVCPVCQERNYFNCIKEYINNEHPTVTELSKELSIPKGKIYRWIMEGRIQYIPGTGFTNIFCERCGNPITTGSLCMECAKEVYKKKEKNIISIKALLQNNEGKIRREM